MTEHNDDFSTPTDEQTHTGEQAHTDKLDHVTADDKKAPLDNFADTVAKAAAEAGYAVAGFAGFIGEKAKGVFDEQRKNYFASHPEKEGSQEGRKFLDDLQTQLNKLVDEATKAYKDFAERGREAMNKTRSEHAADDAQTVDVEEVTIEEVRPDVDGEPRPY